MREMPAPQLPRPFQAPLRLLDTLLMHVSKPSHGIRNKSRRMGRFTVQGLCFVTQTTSKLAVDDFTSY